MFGAERTVIVTEGQASADNSMEEDQRECDATDTRSDVGWVEYVRSEWTQAFDQYEY
jgi:hypothetical protein